jgi:uncharacterized membrane-anchored protein
MRNALLWLGLAAVLVVANGAIVGSERILAEGRTVLLELAPRDPRSLLQGDYVALQYRLSQEISAAGPASASGRAVVILDPDGIARLVRLDDGRPLGPGELYLRYRQRGDGGRVASDAFFFEEGQEAVYAAARFGELRVAADGDTLLVGLRDEDLQPLGRD